MVEVMTDCWRRPADVIDFTVGQSFGEPQGDLVLVEVFVNQELASSGYYILGTLPLDIHWTKPFSKAETVKIAGAHVTSNCWVSGRNMRAGSINGTVHS